MKKIRRLLVLAVLVAIALLMLVQFGPSVVFGGETAGSSYVRAGGR
jgi:hypothetical protein